MAVGAAADMVAALVSGTLNVFFQALPFFLVGAVMSGLIEVLVPAGEIQRALPRGRLATVVLGAALGFIFPVGEAGAVPLARRLMRRGVPAPAGLALLAAAPVLSPVALASVISVYGWGEVVLGQAVLGLTVAIAAGLVATLSGAPAPVWGGGEDAPAGGAEADAGTGSGRLKRAMRVAADDVFEIGPYLVLGAALAGTLRVLVPVEALTTAGGAGPAAAASALQAAAFVLSVSSPFDAPLSMAFSGSLTTVALLAFLVSGAVADAKTTLMLGTVFRWRGVAAVVALLGGLTFLGSVLAGLAGGAGG